MSKLTREEALERMAELRAESAELGRGMAELQDEFAAAAASMQADLQQLTAVVMAKIGGPLPGDAAQAQAQAPAAIELDMANPAHVAMVEDEVARIMDTHPGLARKALVAEVKAIFPTLSNTRIKAAINAVHNRC